MSRRGALRDFGPAAFENDQRFFARRGFAGDFKQLMRLFESFDKRGDNVGVFVFDEVIEVFFDGGAGLIAAGDDMAQTDMAVEHQRVGDGRAQSAALRNQRDGAGKKSRRNRRGEQRRFAENIQHAVTVRAADEKAAFLGKSFEPRLALFAFRASFSEARGENNGGAHAGIRRGIQQIRHMAIGHRQDRRNRRARESPRYRDNTGSP